MLSVSQKVLGQVDGSAGAFVELYLVPAGKSAVCWRIIAANRTAGAITIRIAVVGGGGNTDVKHFIEFDRSVGVGVAHYIEGPLHLGSGDVVRVFAASAGISFSAFGEEGAPL